MQNNGIISMCPCAIFSVCIMSYRHGKAIRLWIHLIALSVCYIAIDTISDYYTPMFDSSLVGQLSGRPERETANERSPVHIWRTTPAKSQRLPGSQRHVRTSTCSTYWCGMYPIVLRDMRKALLDNLWPEGSVRYPHRNSTFMSESPLCIITG